MRDVEPPCLPAPSSEPAPNPPEPRTATKPDGIGAKERAFLLDCGRAQAAYSLVCWAGVAALALEAMAEAKGAKLATHALDPLSFWVANRLKDAGETLVAIVHERPARWHTGEDQVSNAGKALAMLAADHVQDGGE